MSFEPSLLAERYVYWPNPYVYFNFTRDTAIVGAQQRLLFGGCKLALSLVLLVFHVAYMKALRLRCGYSSNFAFTLLFAVAIADVVQLACHVVTAVMLFSFMSSHEFAYFFGAAVETGFFLTGYLTAALPLHRCVFILLPIRAEVYANRSVLRVVLAAYALFAAATLVFFLWPDNGITYIPEATYWAYMYNHAKPLVNECMRLVETWSVRAPIITGVVFYPLILFMLCHKTGAYSRRDLRLTAQIFVVLLASSVCCFIWEKVLDQVRTDDAHLKRFISDAVFVVYNGQNALIYFCFHQDIRAQMQLWLCLREQERATHRTASQASSAARVIPRLV